ncbi:hypothetical protein K438DRAFT_1836131, partial [Mycena galopus ATCC 62051]
QFKCLLLSPTTSDAASVDPASVPFRSQISLNPERFSARLGFFDSLAYRLTVSISIIFPD